MQFYNSSKKAHTGDLIHQEPSFDQNVQPCPDGEAVIRAEISSVSRADEITVGGWIAIGFVFFFYRTLFIYFFFREV